MKSTHVEQLIKKYLKAQGAPDPDNIINLMLKKISSVKQYMHFPSSLAGNQRLILFYFIQTIQWITFGCNLPAIKKGMSFIRGLFFLILWGLILLSGV